MNKDQALAFDESDLIARLESLSDVELDQAPFGVIGFDAEAIVKRYNTTEASMAGLSVSRVIGQPMFTVVAPCMNNFMVAQRFEDAEAAATTLDATIDYVLTLRMRPHKVKLRLLSTPDATHRYVLVLRNG